MKNLFFGSLIVLAIVIFACNSPKKTELIVGDWQRTQVDTLDLVLKFTGEGNWLYYKNGEKVEEGTYVLADSTIVLKHKVEEHSHQEGEAHHHPEDHSYNYSFQNSNQELHLVVGEKTSIYKKK